MDVDRRGAWRLSGDGPQAVWRANAAVPQGTPPTTFFLKVAASDTQDWVSRCISRNAPEADGLPESQLVPGPGR